MAKLPLPPEYGGPRRPVVRPAPQPVLKQPAQNASAPPPPPPATAKNTGPGIPKAVLVGGTAVILLALCWVGWELWYKPTVLYKKEVVKVRFDRKVGEHFNPPYEQLLGNNAEKYRELADEGKGLEVSFYTDGKLEGQPFLPLAPAETGDTDLPEREKEMAKALQTLKSHVQTLNAPKDRKLMVFLDDTNGVGPDMLPFLTAKINEMGIQDTVSKGDNATVYFHRLTASFFYQNTKPTVVKIPAKSPAGTGASEITSAITELTQPRGKQMYSSIATGLFNALAENGVDGHTRVLVVSDGLEHTPDTAQLDRRDLTPAQVEATATELAEKLQAIKRVPKLGGARIDWHLPPRTDRARQMMAVLEKVWVPLLQSKGAKIEMHY